MRTRIRRRRKKRRRERERSWEAKSCRRSRRRTKEG
jgi:hypothetical protein